jgi:hypothetical protein
MLTLPNNRYQDNAGSRSRSGTMDADGRVHRCTAWLPAGTRQSRRNVVG